MAQQKRKRNKTLLQRAQENKNFQASLTVILPVLLGIVIFGLWEGQVLHQWFHTDTYTMPLISKMGSIFIDNIDKIAENALATVKVAAIGLLLGCLLGYGVAVLASFFPNVGKGGLSIIGAFASIPVVAMAPVINNWTKDVSNQAEMRSTVAKIIVVLLVSAANMSLNAYRGLTEVKPYSTDLLNIYAAPKRMELFKLRIPNSVPYVFIALKVAVPASLMTTIVSEYFAEYITGVGRQIRENIVLAQYATAWAYIIAACLLGVLSYVILMIAQAILLRKYS